MISILLLPINIFLGLFCFLNYSFEMNILVGAIGLLCELILIVFLFSLSSENEITHETVSISSFIAGVIMNLIAYKMTHFPQGLNLI